MQIVDTPLIFKTQHVDLEVSASRSQKSKFCKAYWANFTPFFFSQGSSKRGSVQICCFIGYE